MDVHCDVHALITKLSFVSLAGQSRDHGLFPFCRIVPGGIYRWTEPESRANSFIRSLLHAYNSPLETWCLFVQANSRCQGAAITARRSRRDEQFIPGRVIDTGITNCDVDEYRILMSPAPRFPGKSDMLNQPPRVKYLRLPPLASSAFPHSLSLFSLLSGTSWL